MDDTELYVELLRLLNLGGSVAAAQPGNHGITVSRWAVGDRNVPPLFEVDPPRCATAYG
ncbi:hypothetical protein ACPA54_30965 [Uniformispora flossi]|uniref:hypothetical protein n=1 Tax=Uniformispora flossi TaxID=3390723 RepID=UPI003C2AB954